MQTLFLAMALAAPVNTGHFLLELHVDAAQVGNLGQQEVNASLALQIVALA